jgi:hypothetical protein
LTVTVLSFCRSNAGEPSRLAGDGLGAGGVCAEVDAVGAKGAAAGARGTAVAVLLESALDAPPAPFLRERFVIFNMGRRGVPRFFPTALKHVAMISSDLSAALFQLSCLCLAKNHFSAHSPFGPTDRRPSLLLCLPACHSSLVTGHCFSAGTGFLPLLEASRLSAGADCHLPCAQQS